MKYAKETLIAERLNRQDRSLLKKALGDNGFKIEGNSYILNGRDLPLFFLGGAYLNNRGNIEIVDEKSPYLLKALGIIYKTLGVKTKGISEILLNYSQLIPKSN